MEPPLKRQKISQAESFPAPSRTINLDSFQRPLYVRKPPSKIILPRVPDVTVTAAVLEVAVNEGSLAVQVTAPTGGSVAVTLSNLGTVTVPPIETPSTLIRSATTSNSSQASSLNSSTSGSSLPSNSTITSSDRTVTITATNTFHISYKNGTFITPAQTYKTRPTSLSSVDESNTDSSLESVSYTFGQGFTGTNSYVESATTSISGVVAVGTSTTTHTKPSTSSTQGSEPSAPVLTPQQTQMVGGIVGGVAGIALVFVVILYVLRWYRQRMRLASRSERQIHHTYGHGGHFDDKALATLGAPISQSDRIGIFAPVSMKKFRPRSDLTVNTVSTSSESEKGFHRISGRKIAPVLSTGGDQYGGSFGVFGQNTDVKHEPLHQRNMHETTFYEDDNGRYYTSNAQPMPTNPFTDAAAISPVTPTTPKPFINHSRPRPAAFRRPSNPYSSTTSALTSPSITSPFARHTHNMSTDSHFDPTTFDDAFARNTNVVSGITSPRARPDGFAISRNSPARTPVIQSPAANTLKLPVGIVPGYAMDDDIPEMPLPSPGIGLGVGMRDTTRVPSALSAVTVSSGSSMRGTESGRFRENL